MDDLGGIVPPTGDSELDELISTVKNPHLASAIITEAIGQGVKRSTLLRVLKLWRADEYKEAGGILNSELIALRLRRQRALLSL